METNAKSLHEMYMAVLNVSGEEKAKEFVEENFTDQEIAILKDYIKRQKKHSKRNWHIQDFVSL